MTFHTGARYYIRWMMRRVLWKMNRVHAPCESTCRLVISVGMLLVIYFSIQMTSSAPTAITRRWTPTAAGSSSNSSSSRWCYNWKLLPTCTLTATESYLLNNRDVLLSCICDQYFCFLLCFVLDQCQSTHQRVIVVGTLLVICICSRYRWLAVHNSSLLL